MKLYVLDRTDAAQTCRLLIRLGNDCASLQWSHTIRDIPEDTLEGLETVQSYAERMLEHFCAQGKLFRELTEEEESLWHQWSKNAEALRQIMGSSVVLAGKESQIVREALRNVKEAAFLLEALDGEQNLVLI